MLDLYHTLLLSLQKQKLFKKTMEHEETKNTQLNVYID